MLKDRKKPATAESTAFRALEKQYHVKMFALLSTNHCSILANTSDPTCLMKRSVSGITEYEVIPEHHKCDCPTPK